MSVSLNGADVTFLGDNFTFIDSPGSIEFQHEGSLALTACDAAVVVCEPDPKRVPALQIILKQLEDRGIPHFLFLNKIDASEVRVGTRVRMRDASGAERDFTILGPWDSKPEDSIYSYESEFAQRLLGSRPGDRVNMPEGPIEVLSILPWR